MDISFLHNTGALDATQEIVSTATANGGKWAAKDEILTEQLTVEF
jgi:hypothetical protein